jgi:hypothetical protein
MLQYVGPLNFRITDRKMRLFACAIARRQGTNDISLLKAIEDAEAWADSGVKKSSEYDMNAPSAFDAARYACTLDWGESNSLRRVTQVEKAVLLREIAGNLHRPVTYPCCEGVQRVERVPGDATTLTGGVCPVHGNTCHLPGTGWLTPTVLSVARAAYEERPGRVCERCSGLGHWLHGTAPLPRTCDTCRGTGGIDDGTLDPVRLAILADALEEAGCDSSPLLMHLRGRERLCHPSACADPYGTLRGPHVRGCWVLDLMVTVVMENQRRLA